jgi:hypothetical protein
VDIIIPANEPHRWPLSVLILRQLELSPSEPEKRRRKTSRQPPRTPFCKIFPSFDNNNVVVDRKDYHEGPCCPIRAVQRSYDDVDSTTDDEDRRRRNEMQAAQVKLKRHRRQERVVTYKVKQLSFIFVWRTLTRSLYYTLSPRAAETLNELVKQFGIRTFHAATSSMRTTTTSSSS